MDFDPVAWYGFCGVPMSASSERAPNGAREQAIAMDVDEDTAADTAWCWSTPAAVPAL